MSILSNVKGGVCCVPECRKYMDLPFVCPKCRQTTCENHRIFQDHDCKGFIDAKVPQCPMCNQLVPCKVGDDPNLIISRHIEKGCPKESRTVSPQPVRYNFCSFGKCTANEHCLIVCKFCGNQFCVSHRLQEDHNCVKLREEQQRKQQQQKSRVGGIHSPTSTSSSATGYGSGSGSSGMLPPISNTPMTAIGNPNVEPQDRFLVCVYFLLPESRTPPCYMYFNSSWVVGKVLDKCCEQGKVKNENNSADQSKHVHLFALKSSCILPTSVTLASLRSILTPGDPIILYRGPTLPPTLFLPPPLIPPPIAVAGTGRGCGSESGLLTSATTTTTTFVRSPLTTVTPPPPSSATSPQNSGGHNNQECVVC